jgi:hypothetical protein
MTLADSAPPKQRQPAHPDRDFTSAFSKEEVAWFDSGNRHLSAELRRAIINRDTDTCRLTGVHLQFLPGYWNTASFDRFDSKQPYTLENTQLVAKHANFVKQKSITHEQFTEWLNWIRKTKNLG